MPAVALSRVGARVVEAGTWQRLEALPDPRSPQGRIYPLACLVAIAICAFTAAGNDRFTAVGQWIRRASQVDLARLRAPWDPIAGRYRAPDEKPIRVVLDRLDPRALARALLGPGPRAAVAPEPSKEPCIEPPAAPPRVDEAPALDGQGGGPIGEFFTALGPDWRLTAAQRARLAAAVTAALTAGWTPRTLAAVTGANTSGVRNPYAVLAARLAPAELPLPHIQRPSRPPWCGQCDERTRLLGFDGGAPRPCPRCKPSAVASRAGHGEIGRLGLCTRPFRPCPIAVRRARLSIRCRTAHGPGAR